MGSHFEIVEYVRKQLDTGYPEMQIKNTLSKVGWSDEEIENAFNDVKNTQNIEEHHDIKKSFGQRLIGFLLKPLSSFEHERETKAIDSFKFALMLSIIFGLLSGIASLFFPVPMSLDFVAVTQIIFALISSIFYVIIGLTLSSLWLHLWCLLLGAKNGLKETQKAVFFGSTPLFIFGWIPYVLLITIAWVSILEIIGIYKLHKISGIRALVSVLLSTIVPLLIVLLFFFSLISVMLFSGGMPTMNLSNTL